MSEESSLVLSPDLTSAESSEEQLTASVSTKIKLVPVTSNDADFLYRTYASSRAGEMALTGWNSEQQSAFLHMQFNAQTRSYSAQFPAAEYRIIEWDGTPAGRVIVDRAVDEILLIDIALLSRFQRRGIGSELISRLMEEAAETEKLIRLYVERFNPVLPWYERLGFKTISEDAIYLEMIWKSSTLEDGGTHQVEPCI